MNGKPLYDNYEMHFMVTQGIRDRKTLRVNYPMANKKGAAGVSAVACPVLEIDYPALAAADIVVIGTWTDGMVLFGQRPGRVGRLWTKVPALDRKKTALYCTFAVAPGKTPLEVEAKLAKVTPQEFLLHAHHWLILHGRYICKARSPECWRCPIVDLCRYRDKKLVPPKSRSAESAGQDR